MPPAVGARLDHVRGHVPGGPCAELAQLPGGRHALAVGGEPVTEHVGDDAQLGFLADRAVGRGLGADVAGGPDELGVGVTDLGAADASQPDLVDQHPPGEPVVDDAAALGATAQRTGRETHPDRVPIRQTGRVTTVIRFAGGIPDDSVLRLCGTLDEGRRALELGVGPHSNALAFAAAGARALAIDQDPGRIERLRGEAAAAEVSVQCHTGDLADLGFATSASIDLALADHTLDAVDDLGRLLRQVHRVLRTSRPLVIVVPHPFAEVHDASRRGEPIAYGDRGRTIGDWFMHLVRANFRVDQILELGTGPGVAVPTTLAVRAVKEGD